MVDEVCSFTVTVRRSPVVLPFSRYTAGLCVPVNGSMLMLAMIGLMRFSFFDRPQAGADAARSRRAASAAERRADRVPEEGGEGDPRCVQAGDIEKNGLPFIRRAGRIPGRQGPGKRNLRRAHTLAA